MTYRGRVRNGVVVFEAGAPSLPEGTEVEVQPRSPAEDRRGSPDAVLRHAGIWESQAQEMDRLLDELRRSKQAEVDAQQRNTNGDALD
jgi:hypothetical protein